MKKVFLILKIFLILNIFFGVSVSEEISTSEKKITKPQSGKFFKKLIEKEKEKYKPIDYNDILELGELVKVSYLPEGMVKKFGSACKEFYCRTDKATKIMSKSFKRGGTYNERHPDNMIKAMAYFELFYLGQLNKKKKQLADYKKNYKKRDQMKGPKKLLFMGTENSIRGLIKVNQGRKSMREALGMSIDLDPTSAIKRFWYLGELLALGEIEKVKVSKEMKQRAEIVQRYQKVINQIKKTIEDDNEKKEKDEKTKKN
ncbi:MAG: hypothetical protein VXW12_00900 [Pseudomonadota bacterium]|nr:hypothetical protein [Pseudomonadota bacterium]